MSRVQELFDADPIARALGIELIEVGNSSVRLAMPVDDRHIGWHGRCHGGVLFTAADIAMSYVGNREPGTAYAVHAGIDFIAGVERGDRLDIAAHETLTAGRTGIYDIVLGVGDRVVATFRGTSRRVE